MTFVASTIPNLVSGVSQQPAPSRLRTSGEKMVNAFPSVVSGLIKRPPSEFIKELSPNMTVSDTAAVHMINRDATEKYILVCGNGDLELYDEEGTKQTVSFPHGKDYLPTADIWRKMRFVTVADTTFMLNTDIMVQATDIPEASATLKTVGEVTINQAVDTFTYTITVDGTTYAEYTSVTPQEEITHYDSGEILQEEIPSDTLVDIATGLFNDMIARGYTSAELAYNTITMDVPDDATVAGPTYVTTSTLQIPITGVGGFRQNPALKGSVFIKKAVASVTYAVYVGDTLAGSTATSDNTTASTALEGTAEIARNLAANMRANGHPSAEAVGTTVTLDIAAGEKLTVLDEFGGGSMEAYTDTLQAFDDLPPSELNGRLVKIQGDLEEAGSSYWVEFKDGIWTESVGYEAKRGLDAATMPHVLVKVGTNQFEFRQNDWKDRLVGDEDSNPDPSFVGQKINNMFLFKGRLGLLSGENVILSEVALLGNFYRTTVVHLLSSDLIDIASTTGRVSTLYHAASFSDELILFSDKQQFRLSSTNVLSAETVGIINSTGYPCSTRVAPVTVGSSAYFIAEGATHSLAREIFVDGARETVSGEDIAVQVPSYIPLNIRGLAASTAADVFLALSEDKPNELYVYKWYITERKKIQSAWCKWTFDENVNIVGMGFLEEYLYLVYKVGDDVRIDRILIGPILEKELLLDHQITKADFTSITYDGTADETTVVIPYDTPAILKFYKTDAEAYAPYDGVAKSAANTYVIPGDVTSNQITAGINYEWLYEFSKQYLREQNSEGESAIQDGRLQLRYFSVIYTDTSYFEAHVTPKGSNTYVTTFNGRVLGDPDSVVDLIPQDAGEFKFPVFAQNEDVVIQLKSSQPYPVSIGSVEWTAVYKQKAKRV